jgi:hypothetical protein
MHYSRSKSGYRPYRQMRRRFVDQGREDRRKFTNAGCIIIVVFLYSILFWLVNILS